VQRGIRPCLTFFFSHMDQIQVTGHISLHSARVLKLHGNNILPLHHDARHFRIVRVLTVRDDANDIITLSNAELCNDAI